MKNMLQYMKKYPHFMILFVAELACLTLVICLTIYTLISQSSAHHNLEAVVEKRSNSLLLAEQLRQSSDELTRMVRSYAATGDKKFLKYFYTILDIRDGRVERPDHYERIFWDYKVAEKNIYEPDKGPGKSLKALMGEQGFTSSEFLLLSEAKSRSDKLVDLEEIAINAMSGRFKDENGDFSLTGEPDRELALQILFGAQYHEAKKGIMTSIDTFMSSLNDRTAAEVERYNSLLSLMNWYLRLLFAGLIIFVPILLFTIMKYQKRAVGDLNISLEQKIREINERERVELELRRNKNRLRVTLESIGDGVVATDTDGVVTLMNPVAESLTGWKADESIGSKIENVFHIVARDKTDISEFPVEKVLRGGDLGTPETEECLLISKAEDEFLISSSVSPIKGDDGEILGVILVFRDITEERRLQEQLMQSSKMEAIGQLAGGVAHDFNNMLSGIFSSVELLKRKIPDDPKIRKYLDLIFDASKRSADLTQKLLSFARKQPAVSSVINAQDSIDAAVGILKETIDKRIEIKVVNAADSTLIVGDPSMIQSVFINLGINASHAMPDGGRLNIECKNVDLDPVFCEISQFDLCPGPYLNVEFCDTGSGIPRNVLPHIFEPFFTTKERGKGTGLGLASVYGTVRQHEGAINVYSEEGVGTCFHLFLPLAEKGDESLVSAVQDDYKGSGLVLVVDDEPIVRVTAEALLVDMGFQVLTAKDGVEAVELFKNQADKIDLVLIDMVMPRMNGVESFVSMRKIRPEIRGIIASGFANEEEFGTIKDVGFSGYIRKPYLRRTLCDVLRNIFEG